MFTGIVETMGEVVSLQRNGNNLTIRMRASISNELKIDQSVSHNGVCLTVVNVDNEMYEVTAVDETLSRTNLGALQNGDHVNLERCLKIGDRLDGHIVQGHVDTTAEFIAAEDKNGSWLLTFSFDRQFAKYIVSKGSICVNGISLTVVDAEAERFSVAIIPYTWEHTNLHQLTPGDRVNIEFDVIAKYVERMLSK